jgi:hypothetical protein
LSFRLHNLGWWRSAVEELIANVENPNHRSFKRTFLLEDGKVVYIKTTNKCFLSPAAQETHKDTAHAS